MTLTHTEFFALLVLAVVVGLCLDRILSAVIERATNALHAAGSRLWAHLTRQ